MSKSKFRISMRRTITDPHERKQRLLMLTKIILFGANGEAESGRASEAQPDSANELPTEAGNNSIMAQRGQSKNTFEGV